MLYQQLREAGSASDFPVLMENTLHKVLLAAYKGVLSYWRTWCHLDLTIKDFKENTRFRISEVDDLDQLPWGQPAKETSFDESDPARYIVSSFERKFGIPWQLLRNDDVGAIRQIPKLFGRAGGRTIAKFAVKFLESITPSAVVTGALNAVNLELALGEFKDRTDAKGNKIGVAPKYLIVSSKKEITARQLLKSQLLIAIGTSSTPGVQGSYNALNSDETGLTLIVEPFLTNDDDWYIAADPNDVPGIELGFLDGKDTPTVLTKTSNIQEFATAFDRGSFENGAIDYKVVYDFGGAVTDPNAILKVHVGA
jgi:hypothetical protein